MCLLWFVLLQDSFQLLYMFRSLPQDCDRAEKAFIALVLAEVLSQCFTPNLHAISIYFCLRLFNNLQFRHVLSSCNLTIDLTAKENLDFELITRYNLSQQKYLRHQLN